MHLNEILRSSLVAFGALFSVVDPLAAIPLFVAMTAGESPHGRHSTALRASLAVGIILCSFALAGGLLFKFFGVTLPAFKIAGGLLLLLMAIDMLRAQPSRVRGSPEETAEGTDKQDIAIFPLATPLLAGPGSIATTMVLMGRSTAWWQGLPVLVAIAVTALLSYWFLRGAALIDRVMGRTGVNVLNRIMGLIEAGIAVQFIIDGISDTLRSTPLHTLVPPR